MELKIGRIPIYDLQFGPRTEVDGNVLFVHKKELQEYLSQDGDLESIEVEIARPNESIRIVPVKDVVEPRVKVEGGGGIFPGFIGEAHTVGQGCTHVLQGVCVVTTGKIVGFQEGIIDMQGPGAQYTPFSRTLNLILSAKPRQGISQPGHEKALRLMGLKAAAYLGEAARHSSPEQLDVIEVASLPEQMAKYAGLPRVAYVYMLQSQGLLHDTYYYGLDVKKIVPTFMLPTEAMDGALVSGNCVSACDKNTTYHHQNNPIIEDLLAFHGQDLCFVGCILTNENITLKDKKRSSSLASGLMAYLGVEGAIVSEEGFGNPDTDLIMNCVNLEEKGIRTVLLTDEYAGRDGASQSLADAHKLADAVISTGNANMTLNLPPMAHIIGDDRVADVMAGGFQGSRREDGSLLVEIQAIMGSTNELGLNRMTAREY